MWREQSSIARRRWRGRQAVWRWWEWAHERDSHEVEEEQADGNAVERHDLPTRPAKEICEPIVACGDAPRIEEDYVKREGAD